MKTLFNIFLFLAITAFTADVVCTYIGKSPVETLSQSDDADDDSDTDDSSDPSGSQEENPEFQAKELFCERIEPFVFEFIPASAQAHFGEVPAFCEFHLIDPPYSPPELL